MNITDSNLLCTAISHLIHKPLLKSDHCFLLRLKNYNSSQYITEFLFSENNFITLQLYSSFKSLKFNLRTHAQNIFPFTEAHKTNCLCTSLQKGGTLSTCYCSKARDKKIKSESITAVLTLAFNNLHLKHLTSQTTINRDLKYLVYLQNPQILKWESHTCPGNCCRTVHCLVIFLLFLLLTCSILFQYYQTVSLN